MQTEGTLSRWNEEKGYGFITPKRGGQDIFVHISAFPEDGQRPLLHEKLSFMIEVEKNGRKRATKIERPGQKRLALQQKARPRKRSGRAGLLASSALLIAILAYGYIGFYGPHQDADQVAPVNSTQETAPTSTTPKETPFSCDGRTLCSQMTSCKEAEYFLRHCPNVQLVDNGDRVPCERQLCGK